MRGLRIAALLLIAALVTLPTSSAKYFENFAFGLGKAGQPALGLNNSEAEGLSATEINDRARQGMDVVFSANHLFQYNGTNQNNGTQQQLTNLPEGYYAFIIRGGDGGVGRAGPSFGGAGGMVMGYVWLRGGTTLYIEVGSAGRGWLSITGTGNAMPALPFGGGGNPGSPRNGNMGGQGGGATSISTSVTRAQDANLIAIAGGGGGGGRNDNSRNVSRGGNAGGAGGPVMQATVAETNSNYYYRDENTHNPILNGYDTDATTHLTNIYGPRTTWVGPTNNAANNPAATVIHVVYNLNGVHGLVSPGYQGGVMLPKDGNRSIKSTARSAGSPDLRCGGGGGATVGGRGGDDETDITQGAGAALQGASARSNTNGGGGGGGWFGGGGGHNAGAHNGGGGGGSSFVRHDVRPLTLATGTTADMQRNVYFRDFISLTRFTLGDAPNQATWEQAPVAAVINLANNFPITSTTTWANTSYNNVNVRYSRNATNNTQVRHTVGNANSGIIGMQTTNALNNATLPAGDVQNSGWDGFAFIKYLGPNCPVACVAPFTCPHAPAPCPSVTGMQTYTSWPF